jgi:hypothetical protein
MPEDIYQDIMTQLHHEAPLDEQEKIKMQVEQIQGARDSRGRPLGSVEGDGMDFDRAATAPHFS